MEQLLENKMFDGYVRRFQHHSKCTNTNMVFSVYLPPQALSGQQKLPVLYFLSGLTCTDQNFITKAGAQKKAAREGVVLVAPDTSPRGAGIKGEDDSYDFGTGASFYVNAIKEPWSKNYQMYDYVTKELPELIESNFPVDPKRTGIFGHSMGGHGALVCALDNPDKYVSASAFSPVCNPVNCPWGQKAFSNYLGYDALDLWKRYDATYLVESYPSDARTLKIKVDQGLADNFLEEPNQLQTGVFEKAVKDRQSKASNIQAEINQHEGYDHSYYFIATFVDQHIDFFLDCCE
eukprot:gb/GECG01008603.1/.p1 GENE.gb/GECG01008603.1/~~gb/GECG01008603.1/.p1  ORF type:complete len:291 (+),score=41.42 gb/GECG01008603.1/:1-873(+)